MSRRYFNTVKEDGASRREITREQARKLIRGLFDDDPDDILIFAAEQGSITLPFSILEVE